LISAPLAANAEITAADLEALAGYASKGCVISLDERRADPDIDARAQRAVLLGKAVAEGAWTLVKAEYCTIVPPSITSEIAVGDIEVQRNLTPVSGHNGVEGCFLNIAQLQSDLIEERGWSADRSFEAVFSMFGLGLLEETWGFFSADLSKAPLAPQYLAEGCADFDDFDKIRQSNKLLLSHFDTFVRDYAQYVDCAEDVTLWTKNWAPTFERVTGEVSSNVYQPLTLAAIGIAGGWYEGVSVTQRGTPRPPLCTFN
jgi:hypothetical protein